MSFCLHDQEVVDQEKSSSAQQPRQNGQSSTGLGRGTIIAQVARRTAEQVRKAADFAAEVLRHTQLLVRALRIDAAPPPQPALLNQEVS
jgi:hypothetical protein